MGDPEFNLLLKNDPDKALKFAFEKYYANLTVIARLYTGEPEEAEDIVQQLFINIWEKQHLLNIEGSLKNYLLSGVRNASINHLHKKQVNDKRLSRLPNQDEIEKAFDYLINEEERHVFITAIEALPAQMRKSIELVYFSGQSYKMAAGQLNLSVNTLKSHLKSGLQKLRNNETIRRYFLEKK